MLPSLHVKKCAVGSSTGEPCSAFRIHKSVKNWSSRALADGAEDSMSSSSDILAGQNRQVLGFSNEIPLADAGQAVSDNIFPDADNHDKPVFPGGFTGSPDCLESRKRKRDE